MMWREVKRRIKQITGPMLAFALIGYFLYHVVQGDRGLLAMLRLLKELETSKTTLQAIQQEKSALENRVKLLRPQSLDKDMLEEQARRQLGFGAEDEIVVLRNKENKTK